MSIIGTYVLTDTKTGKFYVGSSANIDHRIERHFRDLRNKKHHCQPFQQMWDNNSLFVSSVFMTETREHAYILEQDVLDRFQDSALLLNIGKGVRGGDNLTKNPDREKIIQRIRETLQMKYDSMTALERKLLFGKNGSKNGMFGRTHTPEVRELLAKVNSRPANIERLMGLRQTESYRLGLSRAAKKRVGEKNPFFGKTHTDETKRYLSDKLKGQLPPNIRSIRVNGVTYESLTDASRKLGIGISLILYRLKSTKDKYNDYQYLT